jgi:hypothetical protein
VVFQAETTGRERGERGSRSRPRNDPGNARAAAPWPAAEIFSGERGRSDRRPRFARELDGEREGRERKLTTAPNRSENGENGPGRRTLRGGSRRRFTASSRMRAEVRRGNEKGRVLWRALCPLLPERGGKRGVVGERGADFGLGSSNRERARESGVAGGGRGRS